MSPRRTAAAFLVVLAALGLAAPAGAGGPQRKTVKVFDNYFLPLSLTVDKGATITWKWPSDEAIDVHDVKLRSGPSGVRKFHSEPASSGYRFKRKLKQPGRYKISARCTRR